MKKGRKIPFMSPPEYGQSLSGLTINLLSRNLARALVFQRDLLGANILFEDVDLIIVCAYGSHWMVHADHTYDKHPFLGDTLEAARRGAGAELRLHGCDPDEAASKARALDFRVLDEPRDQPDHGLRETFILDDDGYVWVPDIVLQPGKSVES